MNLPSWNPLNKVQLSAIAGLLLALLFYILRRYTSVVIDDEGVGLITTTVMALVAYFVPLAPHEVLSIVNAPAAPEQLPAILRKADPLEVPR